MTTMHDYTLTTQYTPRLEVSVYSNATTAIFFKFMCCVGHRHVLVFTRTNMHGRMLPMYSQVLYEL